MMGGGGGGGGVVTGNYNKMHDQLLDLRPSISTDQFASELFSVVASTVIQPTSFVKVRSPDKSCLQTAKAV